MSIKAVPSNTGKELRIEVSGRFDFNSLLSFRKAYEREDIIPGKYVIDLKGTDYLDSSALGMLLALRDYALQKNAQIEIANCNEDVLRILQVTKLDELFRITL